MDKGQELYYEEQRQKLIELNKSLGELKDLFQKQLEQYKAPEKQVEVSGKVEVTNQKDQVEIKNLQGVYKALESLSQSITQSIEQNSYEPPSEVSVKNIDQARAESVEINNLKELKAYFEQLEKAVEENKPIVNVEKQEVVFPRSATEAIPVRLSDGKSFYKALMNAVSGGVPVIDNKVPVVDSQGNDLVKRTAFDEVIIGERTSIFNLKPTWGPSFFRDIETVSGTGADVTESGGEILLKTGTTANGSAKIRTRERGVYKPGNEAAVGLGVRVIDVPTGSQEILWGYYNGDYGFGFGQDATGVFTFIKNDGTVTKTYQEDWNVDVMNGGGPSGEAIDTQRGYVYQINFLWYGYGPIRYYININTDTVSKKYEVHRAEVPYGLSIKDPNQPITVEALNGGTTSTNLNLALGGRQFETLGGKSENQRRPVLEKLSGFTTATNTNWQPIMAVRKKANFGPSGRENSVQAIFKESQVAADGELETRVTFGGTTSNLSWQTPSTWDSSETGIEVKLTGGTPLTASDVGYTIEYGYIPGGGVGQSTGATTKEEEITIGSDTELILWVRRYTSSGSISVRHAHIKWEEIW